MLENINEIFGYLVGILAYFIYGVQWFSTLIVLVLLIGSLTFTLYFKFINVKRFYSFN